MNGHCYLFCICTVFLQFAFKKVEVEEEEVKMLLFPLLLKVLTAIWDYATHVKISAS